MPGYDPPLMVSRRCWWCDQDREEGLSPGGGNLFILRQVELNPGGGKDGGELQRVSLEQKTNDKHELELFMNLCIALQLYFC